MELIRNSFMIPTALCKLFLLQHLALWYHNCFLCVCVKYILPDFFVIISVDKSNTNTYGMVSAYYMLILWLCQNYSESVIIISTLQMKTLRSSQGHTDMNMALAGFRSRWAWLCSLETPTATSEPSSGLDTRALTKQFFLNCIKT